MLSPGASSFFCAIPHLEIHAEHMEFDALLPHSKSMWTSHKGTSARKRFSTTLVQVERLSNYASTDRQSEESFFSALFSVSWSKFGAAEILPPVHREDLCVLVSTEKENIELDPYLNARIDPRSWKPTLFQLALQTMFYKQLKLPHFFLLPLLPGMCS